jgi:hypothetical protein
MHQPNTLVLTGEESFFINVALAAIGTKYSGLSYTIVLALGRSFD